MTSTEPAQFADYGSPGPEAETVHRCPAERSGIMPCCGRTPFEVPPYHRMTLDDALVTCAQSDGPEEPKGFCGPDCDHTGFDGGSDAT